MSTRSHTSAIVLIVLFAGCFGCSIAMADDLADVTAANNDFYAALNARDPDMIARIYAHEPYVANTAPGSGALEAGWPGVEKWARSLAENIDQMNVTPSDVHVRTNGNTAWVVDREHATGTLNGGKAFDWSLVSTNIYETVDGRWLMVLHQAQLMPK